MSLTVGLLVLTCVAGLPALAVAVLWPAALSEANTGSPKPIIGFVPWPLRANTRKAFRLATDGSTVTACRFTSQAASR